jgi:DNA-binding XRE family transcriptional regulator
MNVFYAWPQNNWLQRETPLGIPIFTPFHVRPWTENCLFIIDAQIIRMVYIGGLATNDPAALAWTLYAPAPPERRGVEPRHPWLTSREQFPTTLGYDVEQRHGVEGLKPAGRWYHEELALIEKVSGLSRRRLADWLRTSHTTLNGIARNDRNPRMSLAVRITALSRFMQTLASLHGLDGTTMRKALTTHSLDDKSALYYVSAGDYESAEMAAQFALSLAKKYRSDREGEASRSTTDGRR